MISGASEEELIEAIGRADVLLEFIPKIKQLQKENKQQKEVIDKAIKYIEERIKYECDNVFNGMQFYSYHLYNFNKQDLLDILNEVSK